MTTISPELTQTEAPMISQDNLATMIKSGTQALGEGDLRSALEVFEQVISAFPDQPEGHNNLGALYTSLGEFAKAEACFDRVHDLLPHNANILYNRGVVRSRQEKFDGAREDFEGALKACPEDSDLHNNLGVVAHLQGRLKQAKKHFRKATKIDPMNTNVLLNLCDVEIAEGNQAAAVMLCETFLEKKNDMDVRRHLFDLLSSGCRQALEKASQAAELLLVKDTGNQKARMELGKLIQARTLLNTTST